jgi:sporulation protein YlmC with PRC-barrel domain
VGPIELSGWNQAELRKGYSAERLIGMHVRDRRDRSIGEIDNILMTRDGRAQAVIVSADGVLGLGETYYRVPWNQVRFDQRTNSVSVPISEDNVERFRWGAEDVNVAANELKMRNVMDGSVKLEDGYRFGAIDDLVIGRDGRVKVLVVASATAHASGRYALPYGGEIFYSESDKAFTLPFDREDVVDLRPLDYGGLGIGGTLGLGAEGSVGVDGRRY